MKPTVCILFSCVVTYIPPRYSCVHLMERPLALQVRTNAARPDLDFKKKRFFHLNSYSRYLLNLPNDLAENFIRETRKSQSNAKLKNVDLKSTDSRNNATEYLTAVTEIKTDDHKSKNSSSEAVKRSNPHAHPTITKYNNRRFMTEVESKETPTSILQTGMEHIEETDAKFKDFISMKIEQAILNTERKIKSVQQIKETYQREAPYRAGFIISMIKKTADTIRELFNLAVKHKNEYRYSQQMNLLEIILRSSVDWMNLGMQLVEVHIEHINATYPGVFDDYY